jgi:hypothetical protein
MPWRQTIGSKEDRMDTSALKAYLDGWSRICNCTPETVAAMVGGAHPEIRFSDVNSPNVHVGHDALRALCELATSKYAGASIAYRDLLFDGRNWSVRWTLSGPRPDGSRFSRRGASAGSVAGDGRVVEHTDYWSRGEIHA